MACMGLRNRKEPRERTAAGVWRLTGRASCGTENEVDGLTFNKRPRALKTPWHIGLISGPRLRASNGGRRCELGFEITLLVLPRKDSRYLAPRACASLAACTWKPARASKVSVGAPSEALCIRAASRRPCGQPARSTGLHLHKESQQSGPRKIR